jgi:WD40 repeat protein
MPHPPYRSSLLLIALFFLQISGWSVPERELKTSFPGHSDTVLDLLSLSDLDCLASGSSDTSVCIWDLHVGRLRQKLVRESFL